MKNKAIILIDYANIKAWLVDKKLHIDLKMLYEVFNLAGVGELRIYYGMDKENKNIKFFEALRKIGFVVVTKPVQYFVVRLVEIFKKQQNRRWLEALPKELRVGILEKAIKLDKAGIGLFEPKANFDVEITGDALNYSNNFDTIILFSGDGDFADLVKRLKKRGKRIIIVSGRKFLSGNLITEAHKFVTMERLAKEIENLVWKANKAKPASRQVLKNCIISISKLFGLSSHLSTLKII